ENDSADYAMRGSNHHSYRARATRAAKASAEFNERQNCGELIADEAAPDETEKAERITESFVEANSKRRSAARTSEASSWISATLSVPPSDALGKRSAATRHVSFATGFDKQARGNGPTPAISLLPLTRVT